VLGVAAVMDRRQLEVGDQMREHILDIGLMLFQRDLVSAALEVVEIVQFSWFCVFKEQFGWAWTLSLRRRLNGRGTWGSSPAHLLAHFPSLVGCVSLPFQFAPVHRQR